MLGDVVISVIVALGLIIKFRTLDKIIISILDDNPDTMDIIFERYDPKLVNEPSFGQNLKSREYP